MTQTSKLDRTVQLVSPLHSLQPAISTASRPLPLSRCVTLCRVVSNGLSQDVRRTPQESCCTTA